MKLATIFLIYIFSYSLQAQDILWEKSYGGTKSEHLYDIQPTDDYGFILVGSSLSDKSGSKTEKNIKDFDYWIWKMNEEGDQDWQKSFGGEGLDMLKSINKTQDGGFILAGTSTSMKGNDKKADGFGNQDIWIIKLNAKGDEEWQKTIGGSGKELLSKIIQTKDGGFIIGASSNSSISGTKKEKNYGSQDYYLIKIDSKGYVDWEKTFGGKYKDILEDIIITTDGGFLIGGWSNSPISNIKNEDATGEGDFWVLKTDANGKIEWQRTIGGDQDDHLSSILEMKDGSFIIAGNSSSNTGYKKKSSNGKGADFWIINIDFEGEIIWDKTYDFGKNDILVSIIENSDGTMLVGGYAKSENIGLKTTDKKGVNDYVALKIMPNGKEKWRKVVGSNGDDKLTKFIKTRDGNYLFAGTSKGKPSRNKNTGNGKNDFWIVKLGVDQVDEKDERHNGLEAYPNPTEAFTNIIVNHQFENATINIYDITGKRLKIFNAATRTIPIDLRNYPIGVYIVSIETDVLGESVKILKSK